MRALYLVAVLMVSTLVVAPAESVSAGSEQHVGPSKLKGSIVAKVVVRANVRAKPGAGKIVWKANIETKWGHGPQQLLVLKRAFDKHGEAWLKVRLPIRPNGSAGWIRADFVRQRWTPWWIGISLHQRLVSVYRLGVLKRRFLAVVGAPATPTPLGLHAIYDPIRQDNPNGFLGPWALHLTAFSNVLDNYGGGPGRVAIHGRGGASLNDPLGTARSHGCIRIDNANVIRLQKRAVRGTPVSIVR